MIYNFVHYRGDTFPPADLGFEIEINGVVEDLTDYTIRMQMRNKPGGVLIHEFDIDIIEAGMKFKIEDVVLDYPGRVYYYDIEFEKDEKISTYLKGTIEITEDVTKKVVT